MENKKFDFRDLWVGKIYFVTGIMLPNGIRRGNWPYTSARYGFFAKNEKGDFVDIFKDKVMLTYKSLIDSRVNYKLYTEFIKTETLEPLISLVNEESLAKLQEWDYKVDKDFAKGLLTTLNNNFIKNIMKSANDEDELVK